MTSDPTSLTADELRATIADLEDAGRFHDAAAYKTRLSRVVTAPPAPPVPAPYRDHNDQADTLRAAISVLDAAGAFTEAAPLKTALSAIVAAHRV